MTFSFIIPVYNGERYISACLHSLLEQTYTDWQAVLVNDGSTDASLSILQSFANIDCRFVVCNQENRGVAIARDRGIKEAQGEYIVFLDIDDTLAFNCLERLLCQFDKDIDIVIASHCMIQNTRKQEKHIADGTFEKVVYLKSVLRGKYGWELWAKAYRKKLFDKPVFVPNHIRIGEDAAVFIQLVTRASKIKVINEALYNYIQYPSSASHQRAVAFAEETLQAAFYIETLLKRESFYEDIQDEIDAMFLLFYSNSTRKTLLGFNHPLVYEIYKKHYSLKAVKLLPCLKGIYVTFSFWYQRIFRKKIFA